MMPGVWRLGMHIYHSLQVLSRIILLVPSSMLSTNIVGDDA